MLLNHVVVSEIDGVVSKVQCRTCGSLHKYREAGGGKSAGKTTKEKTTRLVKAKAGNGVATTEAQRLWQLKKDALTDEIDVFDYRPDSEYEAEDVIRHAKFGIGFVERVISHTRVEILFKDGLKLMAMNLEP